MVIGICGKIGSGKSTLATMLMTELSTHGKHAFIRPLAAELKDITASLKSRRHIIENYHILYKRFVALAPFNNTSMARKAALLTVYYHVRYFTPNEKPRIFYQKLGTEVGRNTLGNDVWIRALRQHIYRIGITKDTFVIIDDVRFDNEAAICDRLLHIDIEKNREQYEKNIAGKPKDYTAPHASENGLTIPPHFIVYPGFTPEVVKRIVERL